MRRGISFAGVALVVVLATTSLFAAPSITSLSPTSGASGVSVTISGNGFGNTQGTSTVKFGGVAAAVTSWGNKSVITTVPTGVANGAVGVVVTVSNVASNSVNFTINNPVPSITSISPTSGASGISVTIAGTNFGSSQGASTVKFGTVAATANAWTNTSITATVPTGLSNGAVSVVVAVNLNPSNSVTFTVNNPTPPSITSLSPTSGPSGSSVVISGTNFGGTQGSSTVNFTGVSAQITSWSNTSITAVVPSGIYGSANVKVWVGGLGSNEVAFTVTNPLISSISVSGVLMNSAPENQLITINGSNFGASQGTNSSVTFNGVVGVPSSWSNTAIAVPVPTGATTGNLVVTANGIASAGYAFMVTPAPQAAGVHFIQGDYFASDSVPSSATVVFPIAQAAGDLNVVAVGWRGSYNVAVSDSSGNTYAVAIGPTAGSAYNQAIYYAKNIVASTSNTVTVTFTSRTQAPTTQIAADVTIAEYSGINTTAPVDVSSAGANTNTLADSGLAATTNQNDLLVAAAVSDGTFTGPGSTFGSRVIETSTTGNNSVILEDRIVTAAGSYEATAPLSASKSWVMQMVAFKEATNQAPVVNAGSNQTITLPNNTATLQGTATDDGLPNNTLTISWTQVSGPGTATFNTPNQAMTDVTFPVAGTYVLQLTANDSQLSSSSNVTVTVNQGIPIVNAGPNQAITIPQTAVSLNGTVTGNNIQSIQWTSTSGPVAAQFVNPTSASTSAVFGQPGVYVLTLSATNSVGSASSSVTITVNPAVGTVSSGSISLSPQAAGPVTLGISQQVQATVLDANGLPVPNATVTFGVTGTNPTNGQATTNTSGIASFSYTGSAAGIDTVVGTTTFGSLTITSNASLISWVTVAPQISSSSVVGNFFASDGSGTFDTLPTAQPAFSQTFPQINFNPPLGTVTQLLSVDGRTVPWRTTSTVNASYFVNGINTTGLNPVSVTVSPGQTISVNYVSGLWSISNPIGTTYGAGSGNSFGSWDANGMLPITTGPGDALPSADAQSLVGGFADATGQILSPGPFFIGNSFTATVPAGATQLLMGMNDGTTWSDNSGALMMNVSITGIGINTRPFTDVLTNPDGSYSSSVIAQGNGLQAGVGQLAAFQSVFTGTFTVASAGDVTFNFFHTDGFVFGVGNSASRVSGVWVQPPNSTPFQGYPVMGAFNGVTLPGTHSVRVHFPAAGSYPYEVDYAAANVASLIPEGTGWKYSLSNPPGFQALGFDDSSWPVGNAPFTEVPGGFECGIFGNSFFPVGGILDVRKIVNIPAGASNVSASVAIDNDFTLWVNGSLVINQTHEGCAGYWNYTVPIPDNVLLPGTNIIAVQARDRGFDTTFDFQLSAPVSSLPSVSKPLSLTMTTGTSDGVGGVTLSPQGSYPTLGRTGLVGAFTDSTGAVIQPVAIGASPKTLVVPNGATQLQLGIDDDVFSDNLGSGFVVNVDGNSVTVPPTTMPWNWVNGGLNTNYQYGVNDGTSPVIALTGLVPGAGVSVAYQSGTASAGSSSPLVNADGDQAFITAGQTGSTGKYHPTRYITALAYTVGQTATFSALVTDGSGSPLANVPVTLSISGANPQQLQATSNSSGVATFSYSAVLPGTDTLQAQAVPNGGTSLVSTLVTVTWAYIMNPPATGSLTISPTNPPSIATGQTETFTVQALDAQGNPAPNIPVTLLVSLANTLQQTATTNSSGIATFSYIGVNAGQDTVQAEAIVGNNVEFTSLVTVTWTGSSGGGGGGSGPGGGLCNGCALQGWIGWPTSGTTIQTSTPITVASGFSLSSGTLTFWPTSNPSAVTTLSSNTTGSGTLATFDPTTLGNGGYTIQLNATANGATQVSQIFVTVVGENKPGRMRSTVTEFKVPLAGIPIAITRTYDSLDRSKVEDLGFGWKLGSFVDLSVDAKKNVTFNFNGQTITFYFTPQPVWFIGYWLTPSYTPQAGIHGSLASDGCGGLMNLQGTIVCFPNTGQTYQPTVYAYTDAIGRTYTMTASGQLISIKDLNGVTLTFTANGITSSVGGALVAFTRDGTGRITDIHDLNQNDYHYSYDAGGNLQSVQYPGLTATENYTYATDHSLLTEQDPRGNTSAAVYYDSTNDGGNAALDGRLKSVTGPAVPDPNGGAGTVNFTTQYSYNLSTNTTTITNPDGGTVTRTDDSFGKPLTVTEQISGGVSRTTTYQYDSKENLIKVIKPCGNATCSDTSGNDTWLYTYDANGFQTSMQAPGLPADSKTYNQFGGITSQTDAANTNTIITSYDSNFNPSQVTDKLGGTPGQQVATYSNYDAFGNPQDTTDANGKATHFDYYQSGPQTGYLQDMIRFNNNGTTQEKTSYTYDAMGKLLTTTDACGNGSCPDITVGTSHTTTNTYDQLERLATVTDLAGTVTKYLYDNNGNKTDQYDGFGSSLQRHTVYQYDNLNHLTQITYPDLSTKQYSYDWRGNKTQETDQLGHITKYGYDLAGQLTSVVQAYNTADAGTVSYTYDLDGRQQTITDENNNVLNTGLHTTNAYDPAGRLIRVQDALGNVTSYGYDADGRRTSVIEPNNQASGASTTYAYDERGRLKATTYPATQTQPTTTMQYTYDGMGRQRTSQDQNGKLTTKTYDDVGRLISVTDAITPTGNVTQYQYDLNGNLKTLIDANNHQTQYQYDTMNRRVHRSLPLGQTEDYSYDALARLASKTDFNRKTTTYTYDSMDRLLSKVPDPTLGQPTISFTYTSAGTLCSASGQRCSMTDASGTANYTLYDNRDRLVTKQTPEGTLTYTYDAHGNVTGIQSSNANGAWMTYQYDALNRLSQVCDKRLDANCAGAGITTYSYDATGNLSGYNYPNTVKTQNVFDPLNRLTQTCSATSTPACSAGTKLSNYQYGLGPAGNRLTVTENNTRQVIYGYDEDYRLTSEAISSDPAGNNGTVSYPAQNSQPPQSPGYDAVGNRVFMTSTLNAVPGGSFSYDQNDRLLTDTYDANGNTTSSAGISNTYDFENRMLTHGSLSLVYDGDGNRVAETIGGTTTKYLVDDHNPTGLPQVLDELVSGSVTRTYAYGLQRISENQQIGGNWTPSFYGYDGHGNVRFLTNSAGTITDSYDFDSFGMPVRTSGATANNYLYSGERYDSNVGLYDLRARYFNQATGRFWARDPMEHNCCGQGWDQSTAWNRNTARDPDAVKMWVKGQQMHGTRCCGSCSPLQFNPYIYADDDPVNRIDPMGREAFMEWLAKQWENFKIWVVVLRMGNQPICAMMYADDMAYCSTLPTGIAQRCALFATTRYTACLAWGP